MSRKLSKLIQDLFPGSAQTWFLQRCHKKGGICSCVFICSRRASPWRRWPDEDQQRLADCDVRNEPGWHVSAVINEQVFVSALSKWSHYWWPRSSLSVARISDDFQAPAAVWRGLLCCAAAGQGRTAASGLVCVFVGGSLSGTAGWSRGSWNGDLEVESSLTLMFCRLMEEFQWFIRLGNATFNEFSK